MKRTAKYFALLGVFSALAFAETWQGRLVDAKCYEQSKSATTCDPTSSTTMFALMVSDKPFTLDETGNTKASEAFKNRADRASDPSQPPNTEVMAKITGTKDGDHMLKVETVELR
jgi:hypothetical protein